MRGLNRAHSALALKPWGHGTAAILPQRITAPTSPIQTRTLTPLVAPSPPLHQRPFSQTALLHAKGRKGKSKKGAAQQEADEDDEVDAPRGDKKASGSPDFDHEAAFDLKDVDAEYARIDERFEKRLQEWKVGRFNPDQLGQLKIQPDKSTPETYPLSDLATVVHRGGRNVGIIVSDASYIKPIMSAVQASREFNQQPQQDADNDLELVLRIEAENPEEQAKKLKAEINAWKDAAREVLAARKTKHAKWLKSKDIMKDDVKLLDKGVKALQDKKFEAIDKKEKQYQNDLANRSKRL